MALQVSRKSRQKLTPVSISNSSETEGSWWGPDGISRALFWAPSLQEGCTGRNGSCQNKTPDAQPSLQAQALSFLMHSTHNCMVHSGSSSCLCNNSHFPSHWPHCLFLKPLACRKANNIHHKHGSLASDVMLTNSHCILSSGSHIHFRK